MTQQMGMRPTIMKHLTLAPPFRMLDSYTIGMDCVLDVVRGGISVRGVLGWAHSHIEEL